MTRKEKIILMGELQSLMSTYNYRKAKRDNVAKISAAEHDIDNMRYLLNKLDIDFTYYGTGNGYFYYSFIKFEIDNKDVIAWIPACNLEVDKQTYDELKDYVKNGDYYYIDLDNKLKKYES